MGGCWALPVCGAAAPPAFSAQRGALKAIPLVLSVRPPQSRWRSAVRADQAHAASDTRVVRTSGLRRLSWPFVCKFCMGVYFHSFGVYAQK